MLHEPEFWVAVAFVVFIGIIVYYRVPQMMIGALDQRTARIKSELDEARRLREEAQQLLAQYQRKRQEAEKEAEVLLASARAEAERAASEAKQKMEEFVARRTRMAETKINQAETQALNDVRGAAADAAVVAAERILADMAKGSVADALIQQGIKDVKAKLN